MPDLPASFRAYVVDSPEGGAFRGASATLTPADLPPGEVTVRVEWSGVNFKDGLAAREDGRVARELPADPRHRPRRHRGGLGGRRVPGGRPASWRTGTTSASRRHGGYARAGADPVGLGGAAAGRPDDARRDGDRHRRVHRGDERPGPGGARPAARRRARPRDRRVGRRGLDGRRDPRLPRPRGLGGDRQGGRGGSPDRPRRGRDPDPRGGHRPGPPAGLRALGGRRGHGRRGDAALRAADAAGRRGGRVRPATRAARSS